MFARKNKIASTLFRISALVLLHLPILLLDAGLLQFSLLYDVAYVSELTMSLCGIFAVFSIALRYDIDKTTKFIWLLFIFLTPFLTLFLLEGLWGSGGVIYLLFGPSKRDPKIFHPDYINAEKPCPDCGNIIPSGMAYCGRCDGGRLAEYSAPPLDLEDRMEEESFCAACGNIIPKGKDICLECGWTYNEEELTQG